LRAFTRAAFDRMQLESGGMELASEMVVKAARLKLKTDEVPVTLRPAGRKGPPHLLPWRDGWRHLKFLLLFAPLKLFLVPGGLLAGLGLLLLLILAWGPVQVGGFHFDVHWMAVGLAALLVGMQLIEFGAAARLYSVTHRFPEHAPWLARLRGRVRLEHGLLAGAGLLLAGLGIDLWILWEWLAGGMGPLDRIRPALAATGLVAAGVQVLFFACFVSILTSGGPQR
jgi:hypothetical protein